jgi:hypothetical protein
MDVYRLSTRIHVGKRRQEREHALTKSNDMLQARDSKRVVSRAHLPPSPRSARSTRAELTTGVSPEFPFASIHRERQGGARHRCEDLRRGKQMTPL